MKTYDILYTKDPAHKKRKVYHDGLMKIEENSRSSTAYKVVLFDADNKIISQLGEQNISKYVPGSEMKVGVYQVQIDGEHTHTDHVAPTAFKKTEHPVPLHVSQAKRRMFKLQPLLTRPPSSLPVTSSVVAQVGIDPQLRRVMHPHQIVAVEFLLNRLVGPSSSAPPPVNSPNVNSAALVTGSTTFDHDLDYIFDAKSEVSSSEDEEESFLDPNTIAVLEKQRIHNNKKRKLHAESGISPPFKDCRGAVLADEMGLGKSLVSIAVLWHFVNHGKAKGIIVCPSSLVDNWHKELKKWLGVRLNAIRVRSGAQAAADVQTFLVGHRTMSPVLIISYEMFRKHANTLNRVPLLDIIICDEGHRLKNAAGTQTTRALSACVAKRRIVLTGSPIQNNLDELFAILQFVAPDNELGTLSEFKARNTRTQATSLSLTQDPLLKRILGELMLRRTQNEVLRHLLPPKTEVMLNVRLSDAQDCQYYEESKRILDFLLAPDSKKSADVILPGLQRLRQICNSTLLSGESCESCAPMRVASTKDTRDSSVPSHADNTYLHQCSSKLQMLDTMLQAIHLERSAASSCGKVVIVSNFKTMLDLTLRLLSCRGWGEEVLRLDGSVACDLRQGLVERFNRDSDPCWVFLLAAKAGGVGLNLIGANRLIMLDCDWNPSVDIQAMARVWRQGQHRPVTIYRFVCAGKIEQSIVERQVEKGSLCSVLDCLNSRTLDDNGVEVNSSESELEMNDSLSWDLFRQDTNDENDRGKASKLQQLIAPANLLTETARVLMPPPLERDLALQRLTQQKCFLGARVIS